VPAKNQEIQFKRPSLFGSNRRASRRAVLQLWQEFKADASRKNGTNRPPVRELSSPRGTLKCRYSEEKALKDGRRRT
jgi:hypothetical protein